MIDNYVIILGAMKCGTTSLFHYLAQHPQVAPCKIKEPNFFADDNQWAKGIEHYEQLWDWNPDIHKVALEASTHYTRVPIYPNAAERIAAVPAQFKFIYIMRDPIERIESHLTHGKADGWQDNSLQPGIKNVAIEVTKYSQQINEYYLRFPKEDILLLNFLDLKKDPETLLKRVTDFIGLDNQYDFSGLNQVYNANSDRVMIPMSVMARKILGKHRQKIGRIFGSKIKSNIALSKEEKLYIMSELKDDITALRDNYNFNTSSWG